MLEVKRLACALCAIASAVTVADALQTSAAAKATIVVFVVGQDQTNPNAIDSDGDIAGGFVDNDGTVSSFVRESDGTIVKFDVPGQDSSVANDINDSGLITGSFTDVAGLHCYWRNLRPHIKSCGPQDSNSVSGVAINNPGVVIGEVVRGSDDRAFIDDLDGTIVEFAVPGAAETHPHDINDSGVVVGEWVPPLDFRPHAFVRDASGNIVTFDAPGAIATTATHVNEKGAIAGVYVDSNNDQHSYVRDPAGKFSEFDPPGALLSAPVGINKTGMVAGVWLDNTDEFQGFLRNPRGTLKIVNVPKSIETIPTAINDAAQITGSFEGTKCKAATNCGFVRTP